MKRSKFTEEQIISILREQEAGGKDGGALSQAWHVGSDLLCLEHISGDTAVEDILRMYPPGAGWDGIMRYPKTDVTIAGMHIPAESKVLVGLPATRSIRAISTTRKSSTRTRGKAAPGVLPRPVLLHRRGAGRAGIQGGVRFDFPALSRAAWPWREKN